MKGKRTGIEFKDHEVIITQQEGLLVHFLKKPNSYFDCIKYINTNGILAITGDYGNWIFCREFHPSAKGDDVSDSYWNEKLRMASTQEPKEFDPDGTRERIKELLRNEESDEELTEEEKEYLEGCLDNIDSSGWEYEYYAHTNNCGRFRDHDYVPLQKRNNYWLDAVYDGFEEICRRMKTGEISEK